MSNTKKKNQLTKYYSAPLPVSKSGWERKIRKEPTLADRVERIHEVLIDEQHPHHNEYKSYLQATFDEEAVEGKCVIDNAMAAKMIREEALTEKDDIVAKAQLHAISKALNVVMKRYGVGRKQRRLMIEDYSREEDIGGGADVLPFNTPEREDEEDNGNGNE